MFSISRVWFITVLFLKVKFIIISSVVFVSNSQDPFLLTLVYTLSIVALICHCKINCWEHTYYSCTIWKEFLRCFFFKYKKKDKINANTSACRVLNVLFSYSLFVLDSGYDWIEELQINVIWEDLSWSSAKARLRNLKLKPWPLATCIIYIAEKSRY